VLGLIDVVMISNLLVMVIVGGYETFVSRLRLEGHPDQPEWLSHVNASVLKVKLAMAIIGISSIHLLKTFIEAGTVGSGLPLCGRPSSPPPMRVQWRRRYAPARPPTAWSGRPSSTACSSCRRSASPGPTSSCTRPSLPPRIDRGRQVQLPGRHGGPIHRG